ncbi:hypothetical protein [uncultured Desulfobacter sp.]|uniref:hypothetical protein n=1 Tax=uncultured Desulfobacter sp. TaxID=240139 RepID=UPI002AABDAD1|nr:hypothetical protein [uncultured Desulfobacter sp.]
MKNDKQDLAMFSKVMWGLAEDFGGKISEDNLKMRFKALQEFSIEQITAAGTWLLKHREKDFPAVPTTKEIIDAVNTQNNGSVSVKTKAGLEADKVLETLKEWGRDAEPLFYDKTTTYLMTHRWTFQKLDTMAVKDPGLVWWRKEFIESYLELAKDQAAGGNLLPALYKISSKKLNELAQKSVKRLPDSKKERPKGRSN